MMDYRKYKSIRAYCWRDLAAYIDTPANSDTLELNLAFSKIPGLTEIDHEIKMAEGLFQCKDLTPRESAAAHLLFIISNHRAYTWWREPKTPDGSPPLEPLEQWQVNELMQQTKQAVFEYAAFIPEREADVLASLVEGMAQPDTIPQVGNDAPVVQVPDKDSSTSIFRAMPGLIASELSLAFVGDKTESGLGANNMLEVSARGQKRRIPLAELDLVNKNNGNPNGECGILLGLAKGLNPKKSGSNTQKIKRLRHVFSRHIGIVKDPFETYINSLGWVALFTITDRRGAADERAKNEAEKRTMSFEQLAERGTQLTDYSNDAADVWLRENGHRY